MHRHLPLTVIPGSLAFASSAFAQNDSEPPTLTITFSQLDVAVAAVPVPLGPLALWLSILAIGAMLVYASRKGKKHWLSLPALVALAGLGLSQPTSTQAEPTVPIMNLVTSPEEITLLEEVSNLVTVKNTNPFPVRIETIEFTIPNSRYYEAAPQDLTDWENPIPLPECKVAQTLAINQICYLHLLYNTVPIPE